MLWHHVVNGTLCFIIFSSVQNMDMKTSTASIISASDVSTKDRVSLTDRISHIADEGCSLIISISDLIG